nr:Highly reducing polyketide synthase [Penicillium sclerotiorum]
MGSIENTTESKWATEPIAVIGLSCKFAGDAKNPEGLWKLLAEGRNAWSEVPSSRFNVKGAYNPNSEKLSTMSVKGAHFVEEDVGLFDAAFFNFPGETAAALDPQYRFQLESAYEALENAGLPLSKVAGTNTSVFAGVFTHDYHDGIMRDEDKLPRFLPIGTLSAMASNRISHFFDLRGASMTVDTGCSTALVALHQAVLGLRAGEADMSIVSLLLSWHAFARWANGYGRGEGVGTLVIKRLSDALKAGDPIRAVIRETCLNQDGKTETITSPSQSAQIDVMRECYRRAGLDPKGTQYFEAHGTGTPTGDPIETRSIATVFGSETGRTEPLRIGSIKTNIGHTEAASGLAGIIKVILAMENEKIPPTVNFEKPNPKMKLDEWGLKVATELEPWVVPDGGPRRASINNFGYGGTNSHIILEEARFFVPGPEKTITNGSHGTNGTNGVNGTGQEKKKSEGLVFYGRDEQACQRMVANAQEYLRIHESDRVLDDLIQDLAFTLGQRRTRFPSGWVSAHTIQYSDSDFSSAIDSLNAPQFKAARLPSEAPRIGMVFTGQGAQWHAMARELIEPYPVVRETIDEANGYLKEFGADWCLMEELMRDAATTRVNQTAFSIPICVAVQIALVRLLKTWGIEPAGVTSHSSGEIAAAYAVGALNLRQAMACGYYRATMAADKSLRKAGAKGAMVAVGVGEDGARTYLDKLTDETGTAVVACVNSPSSITISGDEGAVEAILAMANDEGVFARRLKVDTGYHSHHMMPIAEPYQQALQAALAQESEKKDQAEVDVIYSSPVTGGRITNPKQLAQPEHWVGSLVQPVQFVKSFTDMVLGDKGDSSSNIDVVLEVGPHTALGGPVKEILGKPEFQGVSVAYVSSLVRNEDARESMLTMALNLLKRGLEINLPQLSSPTESYEPCVLTDLPSYPWNHSIRHWLESRHNQAYRQKDQATHHLLGSPVPGANPDAATWRQIVRISESPWLRDHVVQGNILYPGAGYISLAIEAMKQVAAGENETPVSGFKLRNIEIHQALVVPDNSEGIEVQTILRSVNDKTIGARGWKEFEVVSVTTDSRWTPHAKGNEADSLNHLQLITADFSTHDDTPTPSFLEESGYTRRIDPEDMWSNLRTLGLRHGPLFQNTTSIVQDGSAKKHRCVTEIDVADCDTQGTHVLHPTTLDSVVISSYAALPGAGAQDDSPRVPRSIQKLWVSSEMPTAASHSFTCNTHLPHVDAQTYQANVTVVDVLGGNKAVLKMEGLVCQSLGRSATAGSQDQEQPWNKEMCASIKWAPDVGLSMGLPGGSQAVKNKLNPSQEMDPKEIDVLMLLRRVSVYFCRDAINALTAQDIANLEPHHVKFYGWMKDTLELAALRRLGSDSDTWINDAPELREKNISLASSQSVDGELICRLGPVLLPMLRGELPPLQVMMEERLLYKYYANAFRLDRAFGQFRALMRAVAHKNPRARVLEIGAGTGAATRHALQTLGTDEEGGPFVESWHFTDISSGFFEAAKSEFTSQSAFLDMRFDRCDIEQDPASQGFELESYDIVVACQVLHATKSMDRTMKHVRSLMKPGASLLLMETTQDCLDLQFIFGLLPGWWLSEEPERKSSPSLSIPMWQRVLKGAGFNGIDVELRDYESSEELYSISNMISSVPSRPLKLAEDSVVLVISNKSPPPSKWLESLRNSVASVTGGALPVIQSLESAAQSYQNKYCVFIGEADQPVLHTLDAITLNGIKSMATSCKGLLWVTRGGTGECQNPEMALVSGFLRVLRNEYVGRSFLTLDLDPKQPAWSDLSAQAIVHIMKNGLGSTDAVSSPAGESEFALKDGLIMVPRIYKDVARNKMLSPEAPEWAAPETIPEMPLHQPDRPLRLQVGIPGLLDTLVFDDDEDYEDYANADTVEIEPRAYGLNFRDVMVAMGQLRERVMGLECAGVVTRVGSEAAAQGFAVGDRVMALLLGPFGSRARVSWHGVAHIPDGMGFNDAASMPMIFSTAYVGLVDIARLRQGQSVLIHAAAGGVGQAAIMLAKNYLGAEVYVTAGSQEKRELLMREYGIPADRIFSSRDASFAPAILAATGGRGVDVVLNSLAGPLLQASFDVLSTFGHFVEIGKRDLEGNSLLEMATFSRVASFTSVDMMTFLRQRGTEAQRVLNELARLAGQGVIGPIHPVTVYPMQQVAKAFRLLQTGRHTGKVVLSVAPDEQVKVLPRAPTPKLKADASYLLVGGVGGLGRSIAHWMVEHGARNLILLSRSAGNVAKTGPFISSLQQMGCRVVAISCDVSNKEDLAQALRNCETSERLPPVRGIVQGAMVLQDSILEQMTIDDWKTAIGPKVAASWNLHSHFSQPDSLDFFIMLSSLSAILGWASQGNYAAGGSYQDALARWRCAQGLPATSFDLGMVKGVGYVAESLTVLNRVRKAGQSLALADETVMDALGTAVVYPLEQPQVLLGLNSGPGPQWDVSNKSSMGRDLRFTPLKYRQPTNSRNQGQAQDANDGSAKPLSAQLQEVESSDEAGRLVGDAIATKLADIFMIPSDEIDLSKPPALYGVDSLVAVELRNMLMLQAAADISIFNILQSVSLAALAVDAVMKSAYTTSIVEVAT